MLQIVPTAFDAEDWLKTTDAKFVQLWMEVPGEVGYFDCEVQQVEIDSPDGAWEKVEYPPFFWWREDHGVEQELPSFLLPTTTRCPRCYSTKIVIGYPDIKCLNCGLEEPLIDFPISHYYHLAMLQQQENKCNSLTLQ